MHVDKFFVAIIYLQLIVYDYLRDSNLFNERYNTRARRKTTTRAFCSAYEKRLSRNILNTSNVQCYRFPCRDLYFHNIMAMILSRFIFP